MSYPNLPENRLSVKSNGEFIDLTEKFKMVLTDEYTLSPPEPKTYTVDIPGGNGALDLTESLIGDVVYSNRKQEFIFKIIDVENFERLKTQISNLLHGRAFDYKLSMDPDYTYHGRFSVAEYNHGAFSLGIVGSIKITIDAAPYKFKDQKPIVVDAVGGKTIQLKSGRKRVRPSIQTDGTVKIICNNKLVVLPQGNWVINDLLLHEGDNELYVNSFDVKNIKWGDLKNNGITWKQFMDRRLYEWYKSNGDGSYILQTWDSVQNSKWDDFSNTKWSDLMYLSEITSAIKEVTITYEWGDL